MPPAESSTAASSFSQPHPVHVLVVEDAPDMRATVHETIELLGYAVLSVGSAEAALAEIERMDHLDVLITDISLPGKSGLDLAALCVEAHPAVKVIFASGYGEVSEHLGVEGWSLPKPYSIEDLKQMLEKVCAAAAGSSEPL